MTQVTYNQKGYIGQSMSRRATQAYEQGEKPKSKWTKTLMVSAIANWLHEDSECMPSENETIISEISKDFTKSELFDRFFTWSSWHHTGKYANATDFYQLDEEAVNQHVNERFPRIKTLLAEREKAAERRRQEQEDELDKELAEEIAGMLERNVYYPGFFSTSEIIELAEEVWGDTGDWHKPDVQLSFTSLYEHANGHTYRRFKFVVNNPDFQLAYCENGRTVFTVERWQLKEFFTID